MYHPKIRIAVAATHLVMEARCIQPRPYPVLEVKLFIAPTFPLDQFARVNIGNEAAEYRENGCFSSHQLQGNRI